METISTRLRQFIDYKQISVRHFELSLGLSNGSFASQIKGNKTFGSDRVEKVLNYYTDLSPNWLLTGKGSMILGENSANMVSEPPAEYEKPPKGIPLYDMLTIGGSNLVAEDNHAFEIIHPGDLFKDAQCVLRIYGDSMEPKYPSGCFVPVRKMENKNLLVFGNDYIIETSEYRVIKRIQKSSVENNILACSINQETWQSGELNGKLIHEPFDINLDNILSISVVLGCIIRNQISAINGK
jgi:phage repressor protein C with HTH and peptisase S24 domain